MRILILLLLLGGVALAGEAPPWMKNVEETQRLLLRWITMISLVGTAAIAAISALFLLAFSKFRQIKRELQRRDQDTEKAE